MIGIASCRMKALHPMTIIALPGAFAAAEPRAVVSLSPGSPREIWAERRAALEQGNRSSNPDGYHGGWQSRVLHATCLGFAGAMRATGIYARGRRNALSPALVERDFRFFDLPPAFDGYRILHITDPHLDCLPELAGIARNLISGLAVDLVAITGDIHGSRHAPVVRSTMPLAELLTGPKVRDRVVAVLGNHDPASMADAL